ncbi:MAG: 1,4-dihydroxy-2-naphthoate octaprenyltransferase [Flavobacteriales bacterium]|jgi:1,4-dihydroxy-2-naphthoate octaprenyltransferase
MTKNQAWIKALRLRTLPLSLSGIVLGSGIAKFNGFWDWNIFVFAMIATILFQIVSNLANDLGDSMKGTDNEHRVGPMRSVQSGLISQKEMSIAVAVTSFLSFIAASALIFFGTKGLPFGMLWFYGGLAVSCILAAITYTVGKKAYGYNGLGDIMVFLFFGCVSVMGVYPLFAKSIDLLLILPASCIGLLSAAVLNLNNMRDRVNDAKSNKRTLVVLMGPNLAKLYHVILILCALACQTVYLLETKHEPALIGLLPGIVLILHVRKVMRTTDPKNFDPELKKVALSTFGIAVLTVVGLLVG